MSKIMHDLNYVHNYYMDKDDNIKLKPTYDSMMERLPYEDREFLLNLLKFLMYSKMVSETTKVYLRGKDRTMNDVFARYNHEHPDNQINLNTAKSKINYDRKKLLDYFDDDMIHQILNYPDTCDLVKYKRALTRADARYGKRGTLEKMVNLNLKCSEYAHDVDPEKFETFLTLIAPYRREIVTAREKLIQEDYRDVLSYINFLCSGSKLDAIDADKLNMLMEVLSCKELHTQPAESQEVESEDDYDIE